MVKRRIFTRCIYLFLIGTLWACGKTSPEAPAGPPSPEANDTMAKNASSPSSPSQTAYVAAQGGLILRAGPDRDTEALHILPYGTAVKVGPAAGRDSLVVDQLRGAMVAATFEGKAGYLFTGYLVAVAPPPLEHTHRIERIAEYAADLRAQGLASTYTAPDDDAEWGLTLPVEDLQSAFLIGRVLFGIPGDYLFPVADKVVLSTPADPSKAAKQSPYDYVTQSFTRDYNANAALIGITYIDDNEVGGRKVRFRQEGTHWKLSQEDWSH